MSAIYPMHSEYRTIMLCYTVLWILNLIFNAIFTAVVYTRYVKTGTCKKI